jgi:hypothetical protein
VAFVIGRTAVSADESARQIVQQLLALCDALTTLLSTWTILTGARAFVAGQIAALPAGLLLQAYQRRFTLPANYDPVAEWTAANATLGTLVGSLRAIMPKDASGRFAAQLPGPDDQLSAFSITLTQAQVNTGTSNIDAALAALV